jgi:hypothetical protein
MKMRSDREEVRQKTQKRLFDVLVLMGIGQELRSSLARDLFVTAVGLVYDELKAVPVRLYSSGVLCVSKFLIPLN